MPRPDVTTDELAGRLGDPKLLVLDVRTAAEFAGQAGYPCDPRQGHIPGARHLELSELLDASSAEVSALVGPAAGIELVVYCHSGQRSAMAAGVLEAAGYDVRNYVGSWHEWSRRPEPPVEPA